MNGLHEEESTKIYEDNLKKIDFDIRNSGRSAEYGKARIRLLKRLSILYSKINRNYEGYEIKDSKVNDI